MRFRVEQVVLACSLSLIGLSVAALIALHNPASRIYRFLNRTALPDGATG